MTQDLIGLNLITLDWIGIGLYCIGFDFIGLDNITRGLCCSNSFGLIGWSVDPTIMHGNHCTRCKNNTSTIITFTNIREHAIMWVSGYTL